MPTALQPPRPLRGHPSEGGELGVLHSATASSEGVVQLNLLYPQTFMENSLTQHSNIQIGSHQIANEQKAALMCGLNVLESLDLALEVATKCQKICLKLNIPFIFKASFDKANRSSLASFRGPGLKKGLEWLESIKSTLGVPILTDVHEPHQAGRVAEVADILQLPAFLARQTDLVTAIATTGKPIHIKKPQFISPQEVHLIVEKCKQAGNSHTIICERGSCFGYNNLVVDILGFRELKKFFRPVSFDISHSLQLPGAGGGKAGGRGEQALDLALAVATQKIAAFFLEVHPEPKQAKCDGASATKLGDLEDFLTRLYAVDTFVKNLT